MGGQILLMYLEFFVSFTGLPSGQNIIYTLFVATPVLFAALFPTHALRRLVSALFAFSDQFSGFSIRDAQRVCCIVNHQRPQLGHVISCDRLLVYNTSVEWRCEASGVIFVSGEKLLDLVLDSFDQQVHNNFAPAATPANVGNEQIPYRFAMSFGLPSFWSASDLFAALEGLEAEPILL